MIANNTSTTTITEYRIDPGSSTSEVFRARKDYDWAREIAVSDEDNSHVVVYEKRDSKSISPDPSLPHASTTHLLTQVTLIEIEGFGWWTRDQENPQQRELNLSLTGLRFPDESNKERFLEHSQAHADYCWNAEPDTLIYSAGNVRDCINGDLDIEPGDLVFIMGCTDQSAVEKHLNDPKHVALGYDLYDAGVALTPTFSRTYRTTGEGFYFLPRG